MKNLLVVIAVAAWGAGIGMTIKRAYDAPVVFKDVNGDICGCLVYSNPATKEQCDKVDFDSLHEVIKVSNCE